MYNDVVIRIEDLSKEYRLGLVGTGTLCHDLNRLWCKVRGKEDPYLQVGEINDRSLKGKSQYIYALKNIDLEVRRGEVLGIIGRNGAGKSTLLKILSKVTGPTSGCIKVNGRIGSLLEVGTGFHHELTGRENLYLNGAIMGMTHKEISRKLDEIVDFAGIERYLDTPVKRYSSGMMVRLGFAIAAHLESEILIVDEVLAVGDAEFQKKAIGKMQQVSSGHGRTVLFVSHNMAAVKNLCSRSILLEEGIIFFEGEVISAVEKYMEIGNSVVLSKQNVQNEKRRGTGKVEFDDFYIEDSRGKRVGTLFSGENAVFVFKLKINDFTARKIDIGFSLYSMSGERLVVLYSSYQNIYFNPFDDERYMEVRCLVEEFNLGPARLQVKGRILTAEDESDWPTFPLGVINVEMGDFYGTGSQGMVGNAPCLIKGIWT